MEWDIYACGIDAWRTYRVADMKWDGVHRFGTRVLGTVLGVMG